LITSSSIYTTKTSVSIAFSYEIVYSRPCLSPSVGDLPTINEDVPIDPHLPPVDTGLPALPIPDSIPISNPVDSTTLSPKQIQELSKLVVSPLTKHGKITAGLLDLHCDKYPSTTSTSSTPCGHPILLSSDKCPMLHPNRFVLPLNSCPDILGFIL